MLGLEQEGIDGWFAVVDIETRTPKPAFVESSCNCLFVDDRSSGGVNQDGCRAKLAEY